MTADALLAAILARPEEDALRLAVADYLEEECGQPVRAAFVRASVRGVGAKAAFEAWAGSDEAGYEWRALGIPTDWTGSWSRHLYWRKRKRLVYESHGAVLYTRGFIGEITTSAGTFRKVAGSLLWHPGARWPCPPTAQPVTTVRLTTDLDEGFGRFTYDAAAKCYRCPEWPAVRFEIPHF